jgi:hypothetical protein
MDAAVHAATARRGSDDTDEGNDSSPSRLQLNPIGVELELLSRKGAWRGGRCGGLGRRWRGKGSGGEDVWQAVQARHSATRVDEQN